MGTSAEREQGVILPITPFTPKIASDWERGRYQCKFSVNKCTPFSLLLAATPIAFSSYRHPNAKFVAPQFKPMQSWESKVCWHCHVCDTDDNFSINFVIELMKKDLIELSFDLFV